MAQAAVRSALRSLRKYVKKPWEITGPCADPEYRSALPKATECRRFCPATAPEKACVPTSEPETVFDIRYYTRDRRRDWPPPSTDRHEEGWRRADHGGLSKVYLTRVVEEDGNTHVGGYRK